MQSKVSFIGIGSGKSGSTWLFENLVKHPEVCGLNPKEIQFFNKHYGKGLEWYHKHFSKCYGSLLKGEFSVQYMSSLASPKRIYDYNKDVKIIAILRCPYARIFSDYLHSIRKMEISPDLSFGEYIKNDSNLSIAIYYDQMKRFYEYFPKSNIKVILFEKAVDNPLLIFRQLFEFLELKNKCFVPSDLDKKVNQAVNYKCLFVENIITRTSRVLNDNGYGLIVQKIKDLGLPQLIRGLNLKSEKTFSIQQNDKVRLIEYYRIPNSKLSALINQDLSIWDN
ncbi:sulfotransferase domain-containing protein [Prosthecochloris sp. N3]|uniref:Sulfotransferase domain-containing protein n=1 Tax=Prosthecochloris ethylica TaxID=2743976 RepID=A0ABR9XTY3_9CHLB|nr:sulfotransferase domain-containing protein [Prosthecochloris ethylica]MBF0587308.1 sulfotransferase domain-containing protein [Prosthecochloris ethylica]MBF0637444.1 sulfotransferase domain-containing protein [Prosthecochloris ethylica]NUK48602.1 sulfotransferase domain-containing protein [Prosthecochloris ethylica]